MRIRSGILFAALAIACLATGYDAKAAAKERSPATESLFLAVRTNDIGAVKASLLAGADVNAENDDGRTPIDVAVDRGHFPIAHYLLAWRKHLAIQRDRQATAAAPSPPEPGPRPVTPFKSGPNPAPPVEIAATRPVGERPLAPATPAFEPKAEPAAEPAPVGAAATAATSIQPVAPLADSGKIVPPEIASQEPSAFGRIGDLIANKPAAVTPPAEPPAPPATPASPVAGEPSTAAPEPKSRPADEPVAASEFGNPLAAIIDFLTTAKPSKQDDPAPAAATPSETPPEPAPTRADAAKPAPAPVEAVPAKTEPAADEPAKTVPVANGPAKTEPAADGLVADGRAAAATGREKKDGDGLFDAIAKILDEAQLQQEAANSRQATAPPTASATAEPAPPAKTEPPVPTAATPPSGTTDGGPGAPPARDDASELLGRITDFIFIRPQNAPPSEQRAALPVAPSAITESPAETKSEQPAALDPARVLPAKVAATMRRAAVEPAIGANMRLGKMPPAGGRVGCIEKAGMSSSFCIEPVDWPRTIADAFEAQSSIYRGRQAIVRYDGGVATQFHALFPTGNFEAVGDYFSKLLGPPSDRPELWVPMIGTANRKNRALVWLGPKPPDGGVGSVLEVREFDDLRWSSPPDMTHGAARLYGAVDETPFKYVSWSDFLLVKMRQGKH